ncbi:hypothetical protein DFJ74DRAFT_681976 [Hyaloraphidium curvatum]|nr:hypothetical protein DFJ74DRAFT_681976 [Hyaloraphidium curvatum]
MKLTPNMMPADIGSDVSSVAFLSTDDFDSVSDYSFFASFRIYFDQQAASGQRRWRRLQTRDVAVPSSALRRSSSIGADASAGIRVPRKEEVQAEPAPSAPDAASSAGTAEALLAAAVAVGSTALAASCCAVAALVALRRGKERRRKEQEDASSLVPGWPGKAGYGRI